MSHNPPVAVQDHGQSIWLDFIHRRALVDGEMQQHIDHNGVVGVTSNPAIFQKAIGESDAYDETILTLLDLPPEAIYEQLAIEDIQRAADLFRPIYDSTAGRDGYVSLEVSPLLADQTDKTVEEARRLFAAVDRPNLMIKIPATPEGIPAIEATIASGINVNVTLIFAVSNYVEVAEAYIRGLERRLEAGESIDKIASVASFFLSRIDAMVDGILENNIRLAQVHGDTVRIAANRRLLGQTAIANARLAYQRFKTLFEGERFQQLRAAGAQVQRPLWASTSTKNAAYPDTMYVDHLIGPDTVNTVPPKTLKAFQDHGQVAATLEQDQAGFLPPEEVMDRLQELGVDMAQVTKRLQDDGVEAFIQSFETLIDQVAAKNTVLRTGVIVRQKLALGVHADAVQRTLHNLEADYINGRIWSRDASVWKNHGPTMEKIRQRLGWLDVGSTIDRERLQALQDDVRGADFEHVVLLGMGGSSLAPEVLFKTFGQQADFPALLVLDNTHPARIREIESQIKLAKTLFIVASKSGTTTETLAFYRYFYAQTGKNAAQFIAITDPGSPLAQEAEAEGFRHVFLNPADIGGRYSALSYFGLVPAALMGLDLARLWSSAATMIEACGESIPSQYHPGLTLGTVLGTLAREGRNKVVLITSQTLRAFPDWIEQLIAESTGKEERGILPVAGSTPGKPHDHGSDRCFVYLRLDDDEDVNAMDAAVRTLREAGHPRVTLRLPDAYALAGEFFRWEYATAVAGYLLKVNPFDEPNVTEAKDATKKLLAHVETHGQLPQLAPVLSDEAVALYADETTLKPLREMVQSHNFGGDELRDMLAAQLVGMQAGDYVALLAYIPPTPEADEALRLVQRRLRHATKRVVTVGYGPRYLHSTGQLHKGGDSNGVFLQITAPIADDLAIPGAAYSFGTLYAAQAAGDLQALQHHHRRALRLDVRGSLQNAINKILEAVDFVEARKR